MRFSTTNSSISLIHSSSSTSTSNMSSNFKKAFSSLVSKLPHNNNQHKVSPVTDVMVKNDNHSYIRLTRVPSHSPSPSAIRKEDDIYRDLRKYYTKTNISSISNSNVNRKRQSDLVITSEQKTIEREIRHKTVKQYQQQQQQQQQQKAYHWKEYSATSNVVNKDAPPKYQTHGYVRDTRSNPNYLRIGATINNSSSNKIILIKEKQYLRKRQDAFVWGAKSGLSNVMTLEA